MCKAIIIPIVNSNVSRENCLTLETHTCLYVCNPRSINYQFHNCDRKGDAVFPEQYFLQSESLCWSSIDFTADGQLNAMNNQGLACVLRVMDLS